MTYDQAMKDLNAAIYTAVRLGNKERKQVSALREMAYDIDHMIDHGCTREEMRQMKIVQRQIESRIERLS